MSDFDKLKEPVGNIAQLAQCARWKIVHDTQRDTYAIVMGPDTEQDEDMVAAARLALEHLE